MSEMSESSAAGIPNLLQGRVVLITGASRGIGAATAKLLALHGASVGVNYYKHVEAAKKVVDSITVEGGHALAVQGDVRDEQQVASMVQRVSEQFGPIDTLVLNALTTNERTTPFLQLPWEDLKTHLDQELEALFYPCKMVVPSMIEQKQGCIIVIGSNLSRNPTPGFMAHSTSKGASESFVRSLALELGMHNIRVNTVAPWIIMTEANAFLPQQIKDMEAQMTPLKRNGQPEDVAGAVLLLASSEARFITGAYLPINGGRNML
jgi:3-oxoacyl-[acyl-carrier protein] reductase